MRLVAAIKEVQTMNAKLERWIPPGYEPTTQEGINGIVYKKELSAMAFRGRSTKYEWYYKFRNNEQMEKTISMFFEKVKAHQEYITKGREVRKQFRTTLKPGDILHTCWGYDQTNVEFFQVHTVQNNTVTVQQIGAETKETGFMCGETAPIQGSFIKDEPILKRRVSPGNMIRICDVRTAFPSSSNNEKHYVSWYA